jgi:alpha-1,2-mannosyltransferase
MGRIRKRLWKIGGLLAAFILTLTIGNLLLGPDKAFDRRMYGHDFLPFYTAGQFLRSGRVGDLYDPQATKIAEHKTCDQAGLVIHNEYGAFLNPPFAAIPAVPLAAWNYRQALWIWTAILAACLAGGVLLLIAIFPAGSGWPTWGLIPLLLFTALPVWQAALHAQNTFFSLLVLALTVTFWRKDRPLIAGLVCGILFFKPQLGAVIAAGLVFTLGWQAAVGLAITAIALLATNLIALPGTMTDYLTRLPINLHAIQVLPNYMWHRHVTFLAWWRMFLQGHTGAVPTPFAKTLALLCMAAVGALLAKTLWQFRNDPSRRDRLIAATIVSMPLLMPYYMDYDLTLLAVAAVLCAADAIRNGFDRLTFSLWVAFYISVEMNPQIAGATRIIPALPVLTALAIVLIFKVQRPLAQTQFQQPAITNSLAMAA